MAGSRIIAWSALALLGRIFCNYLPFAIEAALEGEITWGELGSFFAYLIRADAGREDYFDSAEQAPYRMRDAA